MYALLNAGGLGSYTPSKMSGTQYELGVSRSKKAKDPSQPAKVTKDKVNNKVKEDSDELRPAEEGQSVSWSGSSVSSADMLF